MATTLAGALGTLPDGVFDRLADGYGDGEALDLLAAAELAVNRALVSEILAETAAGGELLAEVEREAPETFDAVLSHPFVRAWAVSCFDGGKAEPDRTAAIAAAVAVRAGIVADVQVHAHDGLVHLPTVGVFEAPAPQVRVTVGPSLFVLRWPGGRAELPATGGRDGPGWHAARWVTLDGVRVQLEDADPYREHLTYAPAGRLDAAAHEDWAALLAQAWQHIADDAPGQLDGLRHGLRAIVPLAEDPAGGLRSASSRHAFGALGLSRTGDPAAAAVLLVHEFQHTKLSALLDLIDLVATPAARLPVGWRADPRPVEAVLQGAYAHLAVADLWRRRGDEARYRRHRAWTTEAVGALLTGGHLTEAGVRFAEHMAATVRSWP
ncbi:HEXXH motif-containing putative peptide modification protein [Actinoplanes sp. NPDC049596]|uniref:aKG-HExxH-type peptide beta-hydroxylase n=1 Tax=unclassified Actinoplanes TaxID=2626549 RepID=UPI00341CD47D